MPAGAGQSVGEIREMALQQANCRSLLDKHLAVESRVLLAGEAEFQKPEPRRCEADNSLQHEMLAVELTGSCAGVFLLPRRGSKLEFPP